MNAARLRFFAAAAVLSVLASAAHAHPGHGAGTAVHPHEGSLAVANLLFIAAIVGVTTLTTWAALAWRARCKRTAALVPARIRRRRE